MYQPIERLVDRSLVNSSFYGSYFEGVYRKQVSSANHVHLPKGTPYFQFKQLNSRIQYMLLRSFQTRPATAQQSRTFYDSIHHALTAPYLLMGE